MVRLRPREGGLWGGVDGFQSHYGAIATYEALSKIAARDWVSIPLWCDCDCNFSIQTSPFRRVSIPLWCDCDFSGDFSSLAVFGFQSHYGAIATMTSFPWSVSRMLTFQSHYGAIATPYPSPNEHNLNDAFNPTMVRLRPRGY